MGLEVAGQAATASRSVVSPCSPAILILLVFQPQTSAGNHWTSGKTCSRGSQWLWGALAPQGVIHFYVSCCSHKFLLGNLASHALDFCFAGRAACSGQEHLGVSGSVQKPCQGPAVLPELPVLNCRGAGSLGSPMK